MHQHCFTYIFYIYAFLNVIVTLTLKSELFLLFYHSHFFCRDDRAGGYTGLLPTYKNHYGVETNFYDSSYKVNLPDYIMKNQLKFAFGILLLLVLFANVSACNSHSRYAPGEDDGVIIAVISSDSYNSHEVENPDRYPVYDYRWGYSYRASDKYQDERFFRDRYDASYYDGYDYQRGYDGRYYDDDNFYYQAEPNVKYVYSDYVQNYVKTECYNYPPRNQLIYIQC